MPAAVQTCLFCSEKQRADNLNGHVLRKHPISSVLAGGEDFTAARFPARPNIVIIKNKRGQEVAGYCFDCYTRVRFSAGSKPSKEAAAHICCKKKIRGTPDDTPHLEITETAAPVAAPAPAPAPAPVITIEKHCQAVAEYLADIYPEGTSFHRRYKDHVNLLGELEGDSEMTSWLTFVKEEISTADRSIEIVRNKQRDVEALQRLLAAEKRRADSFEASYNSEKKENAKLIAALEDAPAAHTRDLEFFKQKLREAHKLLKDRGIPLEPPKPES